MQRYLSLNALGGDDDEPFVGRYLQILFGYSEPAANVARASFTDSAGTRLGRLSADAGLSANDGVDTRITVITDQQICFSLFTMKDGKRTVLPGISITVRDALNPDMWAPPYNQ